MEVLPRIGYLQLLLDVAPNELDDPDRIVGDAADYKFFPNARYAAESYVFFEKTDQIDQVMRLVHQAYALSASS